MKRSKRFSTSRITQALPPKNPGEPLSASRSVRRNNAMIPYFFIDLAIFLSMN
jgi:hypothetical protein